MTKLRKLAQHPLIIGFFAFLFLFTVIDLAMPDQARSEFENRNLQQMPAFTLEKFLNNEWTGEFGEYTRDQFLLRDQWVSLHSILETGQGKLESGGVWFAADGYQIAKNDSWSTRQEAYFPANVQAVADLAARYPGQLHTMIVPSPANILSAKLPWNPAQIDENGMTDDMLASFAAAGAGVIDLRPLFREADAAGQQIYYRTDHHWTTDGGARLAYEALCAATGREVLLPDASLRREVGDFLGTNYAKTKRIGTEADTLVYYDLPNPMAISAIDPATGGINTTTGHSIMDSEKFTTYDKYAAFLHGNNGYSVIEGNGEGSILVVKDSYGNCFVPYLVENYATVGVVDLRAWFSLDETIAEGGYDDILVLYSFAAFSEDGYVSRMNG